jgi:hypothetical protein
VFKRLSRHGLRRCQKKGNITFHTAASTAFPQPAPGTAPAPGPMKEVPAAELRKYTAVRCPDPPVSWPEMGRAPRSKVT